MGERQVERRDVRNYYRFPLPEDARGSTTLLRIEPASDGRVRVHLHRGVNEAAFGDGGIYPWYLEGLMRNEEWLLHLRQLSVLHERLAPVHTSPVADDPRVVGRVAEIASAAEPHAKALACPVAAAREVREQIRATAQAELHERRVQAVLDHLAGPGREDARSRPNPDLRRIRTP